MEALKKKKVVSYICNIEIKHYFVIGIISAVKYLEHLSQCIDKRQKDWKNRFPAIFHIETDAQWKLAFSPQLPKPKQPIAKAWSIFPGQFSHLFPGS